MALFIVPGYAWGEKNHKMQTSWSGVIQTTEKIPKEDQFSGIYGHTPPFAGNKYKIKPD
jgi:hypothetical protein